MKRLTKITFVLLLFLAFSLSNEVIAQTPFNGVSVQEVTIPAIPLATIDADLGGVSSARCWRVYACMDDPDWEMQAIFGNDVTPMVVNTVGGSFYQNTLAGGFLASNINPAFFAFFPELEYDSWFAIGNDNNTAQVSYTPAPPDPVTPFNTAGTTGFVVNDPIGFSVIGTWLPPASQGRPDADNKLLIAQLTTEGIFSCLFNFQFRRLNSDGTVFLPVTTIAVTGVSVDGTPGAEVDICPIVFLPIELISFSATAVDSRVDLRWTTVTEINNETFTVERSKDGENFEEVAKLPGAGNSDLTTHYYSLDEQPYDGINYYRLKQTDFNGAFTYSEVRAVYFGEDHDVSVYPNPAKEYLRFSGATDRIISYRLTDMSGKLIDQASTPVGIQEMNLQSYDLAEGVYYLTLMTLDGDHINHKVVVSH
jgi:hypothetical protein